MDETNRRFCQKWEIRSLRKIQPLFDLMAGFYRHVLHYLQIPVGFLNFFLRMLFRGGPCTDQQYHQDHIPPTSAMYVANAQPLSISPRGPRT